MGRAGGSSSRARLAFVVFLLPLPSQSGVSPSSRALTSSGHLPGSTLAVARVSSLSGVPCGVAFLPKHVEVVIPI